MDLLEVAPGVTKLDVLPATFTPSEATRLGLGRHEVYAMRDAGEIIAISRGVYRKASAPATTHLDLIAVAKRAPRAIVCLVSALAVHDLTDEISREVHIAVPRGISAPHIEFPPVRGLAVRSCDVRGRPDDVRSGPAGADPALQR